MQRHEEVSVNLLEDRYCGMNNPMLDFGAFIMYRIAPDRLGQR